MELEIIGTLVGLVYLWLEYKASIYLWIASIVMPAIYLFVYFDAGLYADFGINVYYLLIALYGMLIFGRKINEALNKFELLPITIYCENDLEWNEYHEMREETEIADE